MLRLLYWHPYLARTSLPKGTLDPTLMSSYANYTIMNKQQNFWRPCFAYVLLGRTDQWSGKWIASFHDGTPIHRSSWLVLTGSWPWQRLVLKWKQAATLMFSHDVCSVAQVLRTGHSTSTNTWRHCSQLTGKIAD